MNDWHHALRELREEHVGIVCELMERIDELNGRVNDLEKKLAAQQSAQRIGGTLPQIEYVELNTYTGTSGATATLRPAPKV